MVSWEIPYLTLKKELDGSRQGISDDQWRRQLVRQVQWSQPHAQINSGLSTLTNANRSASDKV